MKNTNKKIILILANVFPPVFGIAAKRTGGIAKYLSHLGYSVYVVCQQLNSRECLDTNIVLNMPQNVVVYRIAVDALKSMEMWLSKKIPNSLVAKIFFYFKDICYFFKARSFLVKFLKDNRVDVVLSSSPPHHKYSSYGLGYFVKKNFNVLWICDYRDLIYQESIVSWKMKISRGMEHNFEKKALFVADKILVVSGGHGCALEHEYKLKSICVISNAFDADDLRGTLLVERTNKFKIVYAGNYYSQYISFRILLDAIGNLVKYGIDLDNIVVEFYGAVQANVVSVVNNHKLSHLVKVYNVLPTNQCKQKMYQASLLLLIGTCVDNSDGNMTGKVYDYLAALRPIMLLTTRRNDCIARMLTEIGSGVACVTSEDIENELLARYAEWKKNGFTRCDPNMFILNKYSRLEQVKKLAQIIEEMG